MFNNNKSVEYLLQELDSIIPEVRSLANDGCQHIQGLGKDQHINSLKWLLKKLMDYRSSIQKKYDSDLIKAKEKEDKKHSSK